MPVATPLTIYGPSLAAFSLLGLLHSIGAREPFKHALARWTNPFFVEHFWRVVHCALSFAALCCGVAALHRVRHREYDSWLIVHPDCL